MNGLPDLANSVKTGANTPHGLQSKLSPAPLGRMALASKNDAFASPRLPLSFLCDNTGP
jgi:hypothetical protein